MAVTNSSSDSAQMAHAAVSSQNSTAMKATRSSVASHHRRRSLPLNFQANLWSGDSHLISSSSKAEISLVEGAAGVAQREHTPSLDHPFAVLHQLHASTPPRSPSRFPNPANAEFSSHRYTKSASARNSTFSQPVIVRTYSSPSSRPSSRQPSSPRIKKSIYKMTKAELPPVEAFTFKGIMDSIQGSVADDLDRIAEICARSRYSLSNQYEVHMPPHGEGEAFLRPVGDEEVGRTTLAGRARGARRPKSKAFDTLETIYSSSRSSEGEKAKKKSAIALAEEVRGRQARKLIGEGSRADEATDADADAEQSEVNGSGYGRGKSTQKHKQARSQSTTFASMVMDSVQASRCEAGSHRASPSSLVSEPLLPRTSNTLERKIQGESVTPAPPETIAPPPYVPKASTATPHTKFAMPIDQPETRASVLANFSSWLPWNKASENSDEPVTPQDFMRQKAMSSAEGSLRQLLGPQDNDRSDRKGKGVNREVG
ncbi:hypothetical protein VC83_08853 [Pseudogymnoascus destructans]|uniref:Uncharacterized protein n=2 Tax=Pseudogymnoascus destructans TaxID=655981 RepID=L8FNI4_PSED2|nr:uncharacterized protein VC83_08853 [Pseudogymnoascus destructans]ELR02545.1 hypothetical protein GMDG_01070 [Pseudogymnoascus destructans 20631-21]OAF54674.1 hypothetical protein VC83_08853 [Pseudogymnoascus destructans]